MLFVGFLIALAAEIAAFVAVAHQIGFLEALLLLVVVSALGPAIVRRVGLGVMAHTRQRLDRGEPPTRELLDGVVVLAGGLLICVPGFIGDAVGLLLMIGPVRHLVIRRAGRHLARRVQRATGGRWTVVDAGSRSATGSPPTTTAGRPPAMPLAPPDRRTDP